ncbi:MAG: OmpA family protein [Alphaproteobacteria bacterium]|nr:OmpA family protein [Alphaproteobacteria bacterium]
MIDMHRLPRRQFGLLALAATLGACAAAPPPETEPRFYLVFFDVDSYELSAAAKAALEKLPARLERNPQARVTIEGHTDAVGTPAYNIRLGARRAGAVRDFLTGHGVPALRIETMSYGSEASNALGPDQRASALLRRVVVRVD